MDVPTNLPAGRRPPIPPPPVGSGSVSNSWIDEGHHVLDLPRAIRHSRRHGGRRLERPVDPDEVVGEEVERQGGDG